MQYNQVKKIAPNFKSLISILIFSLLLSVTSVHAQATFQKVTPPVFQEVPLTVEITLPTVDDEPIGLGGANINTIPHLIHNQTAMLEAQTSRVLENASFQWQVSTGGPFHRILATSSEFVQDTTQIVNWTPSDNGYVGGDYYLTVVITQANGKRTTSEPLLIRIIPAPN